MNNDYNSKFDALNYNRNEVIRLLDKVSNGLFLSEEEYNELMTQMDYIKKSTSFNNDYIVDTIIQSIRSEGNIFHSIVETNDFATNEDVDIKLYYLSTELKADVHQILEEFKAELAEIKADKDHLHDDRYSLKNHKHDGVYVTTDEINNYVTKEYLDMVLGSFEGGGNTAPTYVKPAISVKSSVASVEHNKETMVTLTPTYHQNDAGEIIKFSVIKDSKVIYESSKISNIEVSLLLKHDEMATYVFRVDYGDGPIKNTLAGVPYPEKSIKAGRVDVSFTVRCVANSYIGLIGDKTFDEFDVQNLTAIRNLAKSYTATFDMVNQKIVYMYPRSFGELVSIKDANNFEYLYSYTGSIIRYHDVDYRVYVMKDAVTVEGGFKQAFN